MDYILRTPLAMVGLFIIFVSIPLIYEAISYRRSRKLDGESQDSAPAEGDPARRKRRR